VSGKLAGARELRARGDLAAAELAYTSILKRIDSLSETQKHQVRGEYYLLKSDPRAVPEFEAVERLHPGDSATLSELAQAYCDSGDLTRALAMAQKASQTDPRNPELRHQAALYAFYAGDFERSLAESKALIESNPTFERGYVSLALAQLGHGHHIPAMSTAHRLEALSPSGKSIASTLFADAAMFDGRYQRAAALLNAALADDLVVHDSRAANKMIMLAQIEMARHNPAQASIWADRAADASDNASILEPAAEVYLDSGAIPKALRQAERLASQPSSEARAYAEVVRGLAKLQAGETRGAIQLLENSEQLASTWLGQFWLGRAHLDAGEFLKADELFTLCQQARLTTADLFRREQPTLHYFPPVIYYLARARQALKRPAADQLYERFLTLKSKSEADPLVEDAERRRKELSKPQ
jgi:tetratricopeptide (TPR) repeat protein